MTGETLRIMWASNAPWCASGYGVQGRSILPRLKDLPEVDDIAVFAWFGLQGGMLNANGLSIYPCGVDPYGNDMYGAHCDHFKANLLITLIDAWVLRPDAWGLNGCKWAPWFPVDHDPIPPNVVKSVQPADYPLTYAKFGHEAAKAAGIENVYIPHGVEPDQYKVLEADTVAKFRADVCEDAEWLGVMISANKGWPSRKGFEETLTAYRSILPQLPNKSVLYIHADHTKVTQGGDLGELVKAMGLSEHVRFPNRYKLWTGQYPPEYLAMMYNAADVFLGPSKGEGFGIPIIEAQACGCPVVVTDFTSMPELVRWGECVKPEGLTWTYMDSWQALPGVQGIADAIMRLWTDKQEMAPSALAAKRQWCSEAIHGEYGWDALVTDYWRPFLTDVLEAM